MELVDRPNPSPHMVWCHWLLLLLLQEVSRAFAVLSNDLLRSEYDRARRAWRGRELRGAAAQPGADVCTSLAVGLREAVLGGVRVLAPEVLCVCSACKGSGREPEGGISSSTRGSSGGSGDRCAMCAGQGEVQVSSGGHAPQQGLGRLRLLQRCPACSGRGFPHALACRRCKGEGLARRPRPTRVVVPVGVETGSVLRLLGQGDLGRPPGDLVVTVQVGRGVGGWAGNKGGCGASPETWCWQSSRRAGWGLRRQVCALKEEEPMVDGCVVGQQGTNLPPCQLQWAPIPLHWTRQGLGLHPSLPHPPHLTCCCWTHRTCPCHIPPHPRRRCSRRRVASPGRD